MLHNLKLMISEGFVTKFKGQINQKHEIGRWISLLASLEYIKIIVEIGVWNGLGTSKMIEKGLSDRAKNDYRVIGLETNQVMFKKALINLRKIKEYELIWGSIVSEQELDVENLSPLESEWLKKDCLDLKKAPNVLEKIPNAIDLLILDGGEFSTYSEFKKLQSRVTQWIILDDTYTRKCRRILKEISHFPDWKVFYISEERNGTAILYRANA